MTRMEFDIGSATMRILLTSTDTGALSSVGPWMTSAFPPTPDEVVPEDVPSALTPLLPEELEATEPPRVFEVVRPPVNCERLVDVRV